MIRFGVPVLDESAVAILTPPTERSGVRTGK